MSINSEMTALADAIRDKSGVTGKLSISGMTTAVSNISVGGGESGDIDLSGVTVTADKMLSGIVAVGADGNKVTGNIQTVTPSVNKNTFTVGKGYVAEAFSQTIAEATVTETDSSVTITPGYVAEELNYDKGSGGDIDLSFITAGENQIIMGYVGADQNGNPVYGDRMDSGVHDGTLVSWHPEYPACTGLSQIIVSGMRDVGSEEDGDFVAYSAANGTYLVTPETERIEKPFGRIYKHESKEWYIWGNYDSEYEEGYWHISQSTDSSGVTYMTGNEPLTSGTFTFEDWDWGASFEVTLDVTETSYEAVGAEVVVTGYLGNLDNFTYLSGYKTTPQIGRRYFYRTEPGYDVIFSRARDVGNGICGSGANNHNYEGGLVLLTHWCVHGGQKDHEARSVIDEAGNCEMRRNDYTDVMTHTSYVPSIFASNLMYFKDFSFDWGSILIKKLPLMDAFSVDFWSFFYAENRPDLWGGYVIVNRTKWDETGDLDEAAVVKASTKSENAVYKQWYHHAFTHDAGSDIIKEFVNGVKVEEHPYTIPLGGDDEFLFVPGCRGGNSSWKYVAQLAVWNSKLTSSEDFGPDFRGDDLFKIVSHKQPYHL